MCVYNEIQINLRTNETIILYSKCRLILSMYLKHIKIFINVICSIIVLF